MTILLQPPKGITAIRVSSLATYDRCQRRFKYQVIDGLERKDKKSDARSFGSAIHGALEDYYKALMRDLTVQDAEDALWQRWVMESISLEPEQVDLGANMLAGYLKYYADDTFVPSYVEQRFYAPVPGTDGLVWLSGMVDMIAAVNNRLMLFDAKTYTVLTPLAELEHDFQLTAYMWLLKQNGINVRGGIYNMLKKAYPKPPKVLKNGTLSRDSGMDCDQSTYTNTVRDMGFDLLDYQEFVDALPTSEKYFKRETIFRSEAELTSFEENLADQVREMFAKGKVYRPTSATNNCCQYCDFRTPCILEQRKSDVALEVRLNYNRN